MSPGKCTESQVHKLYMIEKVYISVYIFMKGFIELMSMYSQKLQCESLSSDTLLHVRVMFNEDNIWIGPRAKNQSRVGQGFAHLLGKLSCIP